MDSTGQSVPNGTWTPCAIIVCQLYAPITRYSPRRSSAQRLSEMACDGCIEAMTRRMQKNLRAHDLCILLLRRPERFLIAVKRHAVRAVADAVERDLKSGL